MRELTVLSFDHLYHNSCGFEPLVSSISHEGQSLLISIVLPQKEDRRRCAMHGPRCHKYLLYLQICHYFSFTHSLFPQTSSASS